MFHYTSFRSTFIFLTQHFVHRERWVLEPTKSEGCKYWSVLDEASSLFGRRDEFYPFLWWTKGCSPHLVPSLRFTTGGNPVGSSQDATDALLSLIARHRNIHQRAEGTGEQIHLTPSNLLVQSRTLTKHYTRRFQLVQPAPTKGMKILRVIDYRCHVSGV